MIKAENFRTPLGLWYEKLGPFFKTEEGNKLYEYLKMRSLKGHRILPTSDKTFRAFELTDPRNIRAVLVGLSPYPNYVGSIPCSDGLAFSNSLTMQESPSLRLFYDAMEKDLGVKEFRNPNLSYLAKQGVLLLNYSLTCEKDKPTAHSDKGLWDDFNKFFYREVLAGVCGIPVVLIGKEAQRLEKHLLNICHPIKKVEHMAFSARQNRDWECDHLFSWCNRILKENNGEESQIDWFSALDEVAVVSEESEDDLPF